MAAAAPILALVAAGLALCGVAGAWLGLLSPMAGFQAFAGGALLGGIASVIVALVGILLSRGGRDPQGRTKALLGLAIGLGLILVVLVSAAPGASYPPINDITTDLEDPPAFASDTVVPDYAGRDMSYPAEFVAIVREAYPDLRPLHLDVAPDSAFGRALGAAESLGWEVVASDPDRGVFDARDETDLFRFVDDVTVRVRPDGEGARIDVRSKSRDGRGDLGANAMRIRAFFAALR